MIGILNYGVGNIKAFSNILKSLGFDFKVIESGEEILSVDRLILPGVGSFDSVMEKLEHANVMDELSSFALKEKRPILGVCVGMQILADSSEEGQKRGLGWIKGKVKKFNFLNLETKPMIPQIGWNEVLIKKQNCNLLKNLDTNPHFYFLHSYYFECENQANVIAATDYGFEFCSAVNHENIYGTQFHPEKSHHNGIQLLKNFATL
ncbi:imidazole glycerol phosphate synthase subunit HisH [Leptospira bouyouniensis]|uniref:Imidazole glycerol phosphate synthase subunit HisH n=1 Tax=Leptospira bouyouniensis TaxID=2484911 RepID=A0A7I0HMR5_9LEPT|nr:imidazole glycerol phosphate synthase subunit HisH [Leptospira bouyouniensis]TGK48574.1 imidazole glycerol phosphate synthase subunit HisH [Leptospira bouyouniensis]TGL02340.1 imidazole glycerol phosphate synthase subunit HisH [Leptospira bouyouniensis]